MIIPKNTIISTNDGHYICMTNKAPIQGILLIRLTLLVGMMEKIGVMKI